MKKHLYALQASSFTEHVSIILQHILNKKEKKDDSSHEELSLLSLLNPRNNHIIFCETVDDIEYVQSQAKSLGLDVVRIDSRENDTLTEEDEKNIVSVSLINQILRYHDERNTVVIASVKTSMAVNSDYLSCTDRHKWTVYYTETRSESSTQRVPFDQHHPYTDYIDVDSDGMCSISEKGKETEIEWSFRDKILYPLKKEKVNCWKIAEQSQKRVSFMTFPKIEYYPENAVVCIADLSRWSYYNNFQDDIEVTKISCSTGNISKSINFYYVGENPLTAYKKVKYVSEYSKVLEYLHNLWGDNVAYWKCGIEESDTYPENWIAYDNGKGVKFNVNKVYISFFHELSKAEKKQMSIKGMSAENWQMLNYIEPLRKFIIKFLVSGNDVLDVVIPDIASALALKAIFKNEYHCSVKVMPLPNITPLQKGMRADRKWPEDIKPSVRRKVHHMVKKYENGDYEGQEICDKIEALIDEKWKISELPEFKLYNSRGNLR